MISVLTALNKQSTCSSFTQLVEVASALVGQAGFDPGASRQQLGAALLALATEPPDAQVSGLCTLQHLNDPGGTAMQSSVPILSCHELPRGHHDVNVV